MRKTRFGYLLCGMFLLLAAAMFMPVEAEGVTRNSVMPTLTGSAVGGSPAFPVHRVGNWNTPASWNASILPAHLDNVTIGGSFIRQIWTWDTVDFAHTGNETFQYHSIVLNSASPPPAPGIGQHLIGLNLATAAGVGILTINNDAELRIQGPITLGAGAFPGHLFIGGGPTDIFNPTTITLPPPTPFNPAIPLSAAAFSWITAGTAISPGRIIGNWETAINSSVANSSITFNHNNTNVHPDPLAFTFPHNITGSVSIHQIYGTTHLTGNNSYTGNTLITGVDLDNTLAFAPNALGSGPGQVMLQNLGTLRWLGATGSSAAFGGGLIVDEGTLDIPLPFSATLTEPILGARNDVTKTGTGALIFNTPDLNPQITGGGTWTIADGTLTVGPVGVLMIDFATNFTVESDASLTVSGMLDVQPGGNLIVEEGGLRPNVPLVNRGGLLLVDGNLTLNSNALTEPTTHLNAHNHVIAAGGTLDIGGILTIGPNTGLVILGNMEKTGTIVNNGIIWIQHHNIPLRNALEAAGHPVDGISVRIIPFHVPPGGDDDGTGGGLPGGGGGGSNVTRPVRAWATVGDVRHMGARETANSFLITVPSGTNLAAVPVSFHLPPAATINPSNGSVQNFATGPVTYTVTAGDRVTRNTYTVRVVIEGGGAPGDDNNGDNVGNVGGSGSSGCNAGFAALGLLLAVPFFVRKRS